MSEKVILIAMAAAFATYYLYRRSQVPNHLNEICNGLQLKSEIAQARGDAGRAREYRDMVDAIRDAQRLVNSPNLRTSEDINAIFSRVVHASSSSVLDSLSIFEQNHRHDCYKAVLNLAGKLKKIHPR